MSAGMLYIGSLGDDNFEPLGETVCSELTVVEEAMDAYGAHDIVTTGEATFEMKLTKKQVEDFFEFVFHIKDQVLRIIRNEGNARVCHLAKHGKKARTRKKNLRRAFRILEREG